MSLEKGSGRPTPFRRPLIVARGSTWSVWRRRKPSPVYRKASVEPREQERHAQLKKSKHRSRANEVRLFRLVQVESSGFERFSYWITLSPRTSDALPTARHKTTIFSHCPSHLPTFPLNRDLQRDVSVARTGSRCKRDSHGGQRGGGGTRAAVVSDSSSSFTSTFPDLPQIGTTAAPEKVRIAKRTATPVGARLSRRMLVWSGC